MYKKKEQAEQGKVFDQKRSTREWKGDESAFKYSVILIGLNNKNLELDIRGRSLKNKEAEKLALILTFIKILRQNEVSCLYKSSD